jgi:hypothetical protein
MSYDTAPAMGTSALEGMKKGDDVPPKLKLWWRGDRDKAQDWYTEAKEDFDFPPAASIPTTI